MRGDYTLTFEISADPEFSKNKTASYVGIEPANQYMSMKQLEEADALEDGTYYWRARTVDAKGNSSEWSTIRFHVDVTGSKSYSGYQRVDVENVSVSGGQDPKNIIDWNDQGQITYWNSVPRAANPVGKQRNGLLSASSSTARSSTNTTKAICTSPTSSE